MHALAFGANLQPRFATLRIFIRWRVQSCLPRETALVYIAILPASARKRALMLKENQHTQYKNCILHCSILPDEKFTSRPLGPCSYVRRRSESELHKDGQVQPVLGFAQVW